VVVLPLATTHYGARHYWVRDPEGFLWGFSTYKPRRGWRERIQPRRSAI
jgi:uncharacterized glyoxalase superfamily protein PhnB